MFDRKKCKHQWVETDRRRFPPTVRSFKAGSMEDTDFLLKFTYGITTVELKCSECGDIKSVEMIGA